MTRSVRSARILRSLGSLRRAESRPANSRSLIERLQPSRSPGNHAQENQTLPGGWTSQAHPENIQKFFSGVHLPRRLNLYRSGFFRPLIEGQWPQLIVRVLTLAGFVFTILGGLLGTRVGSHNFAIIFVWIAWWTALKLLFIPLGGRSWCSICPIPLPGDWLQQAGVLVPGPTKLGFGRRWPKKLKGAWMQSAGFLLIGLFSAVTLTDPHLTGSVLLALFALAIGLSLVFEHRAFCSYLCPVGGFSGMYAQAAPVEVRILDKDVCARHAVKTCYQACPWGLYPVAFQNNTSCGMCMECLRACPQDNLALNLRPFGSDLGSLKSTSRLDEAFLALVMLGSVLTFSAVFTGPWGWLKTAAYEVGSLGWLGYASAYLALNLLLLPGMFALAVWAGQKATLARTSLKQAIAAHAQALVPLGLMAWIAFTASFALPKLIFVTGVLNDPFGWGWNLLGRFNPAAMIDLTGFSTLVQGVLLLVGLAWSVRVSMRLASAKKAHASLPVLLFCLAFTLLMAWLLIG